MFKKLIALGFASVMMVNVQAEAPQTIQDIEQEIEAAATAVNMPTEQLIELLASTMKEQQLSDSTDMRKEEIKAAVAGFLGGSALAAGIFALYYNLKDSGACSSDCTHETKSAKALPTGATPAVGANGQQQDAVKALAKEVKKAAKA